MTNVFTEGGNKGTMEYTLRLLTGKICTCICKHTLTVYVLHGITLSPVNNYRINDEINIVTLKNVKDKYDHRDKKKNIYSGPRCIL